MNGKVVLVVGDALTAHVATSLLHKPEVEIVCLKEPLEDAFAQMALSQESEFPIVQIPPALENLMPIIAMPDYTYQKPKKNRAKKVEKSAKFGKYSRFFR